MDTFPVRSKHVVLKRFQNLELFNSDNKNQNYAHFFLLSFKCPRDVLSDCVLHGRGKTHGRAYGRVKGN